MTTDNNRRMYEQLKQLWVAEHDSDDRDTAGMEFDRFVGDMLKEGAQIVQEQDQAEKLAEVSASRMLMEIILEVDTTMRMVPKRVKTYRDLLAQEGLDRTSEATGENGQKGLAGINLADQAALEFHRAMLGLAISIAQAEAQERLEKSNDNH